MTASSFSSFQSAVSKGFQEKASRVEDNNIHLSFTLLDQSSLTVGLRTDVIVNSCIFSDGDLNESKKLL